MRKIIIISIAFVFSLSCAFAQEATSEKKVREAREVKSMSEVLPQAGDIAIGLDMAQFVKSIMNSMTNPASGNTVQAFRSDFFGKYFLNEKSAIRARLGLTINNHTTREFVRDDAAFFSNQLTQGNPLLETKTVDTWKGRSTTFELGVGYEYRRSLWRVQGYVGGEIFGGMGLNKDIYEWGNPISRENPIPFMASWASSTAGGATRALEDKFNVMHLGAAVYFGADLFVCRNLSIGAEFNLDGRYTREGEHVTMSETWLNEEVYVTKERNSPVNTSFGLRPGGRLNLMIYF